MVYKFNKAIIQVSEDIHDITGIGLIEYHFFQQELILKVYVNNILVSTFEGEIAKELYMITNGETKKEVLLTESHVKRIAAECVEINADLLETKSRDQYIVWARYLVFSYFKENSIYSLQRIGNMFEPKKDHASVLHGLKQLSNDRLNGWRLISKNRFNEKITELHNKL